MTGLVPYLHFARTARPALMFYRDVFGGELALHTFADFGRTDGPPDAVAHGILDGPVQIFAADAGDGEPALRVEGLLFSLLGTADASTMRGWFAALADGGRVLDALQERPWGDYDGQVADRFGLTWLIGYQP
ncbi:VOC family protein [Amnibacterium flavum]|uniref:VOC family protein n=1 Tax=Amnibacterium flavum TaxID=2173173 RepID=A0A2V1HWB5_9MICO|nr:VOC family protein [Amnibacterium flavum]PVZ95410.1 VOC family protein [Amnibacterium flavum]